ncbi:MAG TPA: hypothetical protein VNK43_08045 [Gemmatimonadales bacterium]|nr:hypothetical protein [Gemmatimonadales bacterium]
MIRAPITALPALLAGSLLTAGPAAAQVQIRVGDPRRATYSELHEALKEGTPQADSVLRILRTAKPGPLWRLINRAIEGNGSWNLALVAFNRLAELRDPRSADSAMRIRRHLEEAGPFPIPNNPGLKAEDLEPSIQAVVLERRRAVEGDSAVLADILARIPRRDYNHGDAWVLGRLGAGAADSLVRRFETAANEEFRVRYLTLLSYFTDPGLIPFFARVYVYPDSVGIPKRYAIRASDGLIWIGTREAMLALEEARARARARGVYADSSLWRGGYDFLANDSSAVISRTGRWLDEWIARLPAAPAASSGGAGTDAGR